MSAGVLPHWDSSLGMNKDEEMAPPPPGVEFELRFVVGVDPADGLAYSITYRHVLPTEGLRRVLAHLQKNATRKHKKHIQVWLCPSTVVGRGGSGSSSPQEQYCCCELGQGCPNLHVTAGGYARRRLWVRPLTIERLVKTKPSHCSTTLLPALNAPPAVMTATPLRTPTSLRISPCSGSPAMGAAKSSPGGCVSLPETPLLSISPASRHQLSPNCNGSTSSSAPCTPCPSSVGPLSSSSCRSSPQSAACSSPEHAPFSPPPGCHGPRGVLLFTHSPYTFTPALGCGAFPSSPCGSSDSSSSPEYGRTTTLAVRSLRSPSATAMSPLWADLDPDEEMDFGMSVTEFMARPSLGRRRSV